MKKYADWIIENYPTRAAAKNQCSVAVRRMVEDFPELTLQAGVIRRESGGRYISHMWVCDGDDRKADPTAHQFDFAFTYHFFCSRFLTREEFQPMNRDLFLGILPDFTPGEADEKFL